MSRFKVLIPDFFPQQGADDDFGKDAAEDLRDLMNTLPTHQPVAKKEIEKSLKAFKMKMDQLDCVRTRQLASQMGAQVAVCASYTEKADKQYEVNAAIWDIGSGESFDLPSFSSGEKDHEQAAKQIFDQFDQYNQQVRAATFCSDYAQSQQWDAALRNCDKALELNPNAVSTRYQRARILYETNKYDEALTELKKVLDLNQFHEDALQLAGYISAKLGNEDQALDYYSQYLELNPGNAQVRMKIAYDLAQAGDPEGAMQLIQEGLDVAPDNTDLLEQYGGFAFAAGQKVNSEQADSAEDAGAVAPEAAEYFHKAIDAYQKVFAAKGADTPVGELRNIIVAHIQLGELDQAISTAEDALETHPQEESIWSYYADALQRAGRLDDALAALDRVKEINPDYPNVALRQGKWLIEAGRINDAVKALSEVATADPSQAEAAARLIFADGYTKGVQKNNYDYASSTFSAAKSLPNLSAGMNNQLNFWQGYAIFQGAVEEQKPATLATAKSTLPKFQQALKLLQQAGDYPKTVNINMDQLLNNVNTYIEIQEAIVKRGR
ncbi:MAG: tetratricopeptide repeat protein [Gemmatimonadota bacterium]